MVVLCQCGKALTTDDIKLEANNITDDKGNTFQEVYYIKPCCNEKERVALLDEVCLALQNDIRSAREVRNVLTIKSLTKRLRERMSLINSKDNYDGN